MFLVNVEAKGMIGIHYYEDRHELRRFKRVDVKERSERIQFQSKEAQRELEKFNEWLPITKVIGLGSRKEGRIDIYIDFSNFGRKTPEYIITENYPLYNMLKKFVKESNR